MARVEDPCEPIRREAAALPGVIVGKACSQESYKTGKGSFLFIGPGAKGKGFKAMFRLGRSLQRAGRLAAGSPDRFQVGSGAVRWVTARFTAEEPLPRSLWEPWLRESYEIARGPGDEPPPKGAAKRKRTE